MNVETMLTYKQVCSRYGVSRSTVYQWVNKGLLKPTKIVGKVWFAESACRAFERRCRECQKNK